ncbi:Glycosyltransferase involved in cell wall bisynthesis [Aeromicrobium sp. 9AM]|nr:Glycosyltransferase involved in cell wall bisynthesis [Aeromicrobium sp. 9AM]
MTKLAAVMRAAFAVFSGRPLQQGYVNSRASRVAVRRAVAELEPDLIYFNTLRSGQWRKVVRDTPARMAIDLDEFRSAYYQQASEVSTILKRLVMKMEARRMRAEEAKIVAEFEAVIISSPADLRPEHSNVHLVRSPHALKTAHRPVPLADRPTIVFVGRMSYAANVEAVTRFCRDVLPAVRQQVPEVQLEVVGDAPTKAIRSLADGHVRVHGRVDSVDEHYLSAWLSIVPVTTATGVQMKLIESLELGVPTVASPLVASLAGARAGVDVAVADTADEWIEEVVRLLESPMERQELGRSGKAWARQNYSVDSITRALGAALLEPRSAAQHTAAE